MAILIDSSVWIDWLRRRVDPRPLIRPWVSQRGCYTCGFIVAEVLRGIPDPLLRARIADLFAILEWVPLADAKWREIAEHAWDLDRRGSVLPLTDLAIALCAQEKKAWVITLDDHFSKIPKLKCRRELPAEA